MGAIGTALHIFGLSNPVGWVLVGGVTVTYLAVQASKSKKKKN